MGFFVCTISIYLHPLPKSIKLLFKMKHISLFLLSSILYLGVFAGNFKKSDNDTVTNTFNKDFIYSVKKSKSPIIIDGVIDEPDWLAAQKATDFHRVLPIDTGLAYQPSEIMITYDDKALYIAQIFEG